jgi:hypothetical protein
MFILGCTCCGQIHFFSEDLETNVYDTKEEAEEKARKLLQKHRGTWHVYSVNKV